ncbi:hypothetical protein GCM10027074_32130 [Streptomyces deserti]
MRPPPSRTSTVRPSVSRAPHSSSEAGSVDPDEADGDDDGGGGCGWLSGIVLQGLGLHTEDA